MVTATLIRRTKKPNKQTNKQKMVEKLYLYQGRVKKSRNIKNTKKKKSNNKNTKHAQLKCLFSAVTISQYLLHNIISL